MNISKKQRAWIVLIVAGIALLSLATISGAILYLFYPILIGLIFLLVGLLLKAGVEWCIKNRKIFGIKEKSLWLKKKMRIDKGIDVVKESIDTVRGKKDGNRS